MLKFLRRKLHTHRLLCALSILLSITAEQVHSQQPVTDWHSSESADQNKIDNQPEEYELSRESYLKPVDSENAARSAIDSVEEALYGGLGEGSIDERLTKIESTLFGDWASQGKPVDVRLERIRKAMAAKRRSAEMDKQHDVMTADLDERKVAPPVVTTGNKILWSSYFEKAKEFSSIGKNAEAIELLEAAIGLLNDNSPTSQVRATQTLSLLMRLYKQTGQLDKYRKAQHILGIGSSLPPDNLPVSTISSSGWQFPATDFLKAETLAASGDLNAAEAIYRGIMQRSTSYLTNVVESEMHTKVIDRLVRIYYQQNKFDQAETLIRQSLTLHETMEDKLEPADPQRLNAAYLLADLGLIFTGQRRFNEAEAVLDNSLKTISTFLGRDHPKTILTICDIALLHNAMNQSSKATNEYAEAYSRSKKSKALSVSAKKTIAQNYISSLRDSGEIQKAAKIQTAEGL
ncbi:tetratricopeptide repeat protein [Candidatus Obscuribacterales bacterium]|nr:tetratricopeptide repeat protein [Candidatus Obscuribacterales bacterium]